jgi:hypothetical protein
MDIITRVDMTMGELNHAIDYPRVYKCMDKTIQIDRDASWKDDDSILEYYNVLANEVSKIDGIQAFPSGVNGLILKSMLIRLRISNLKSLHILSHLIFLSLQLIPNHI